MDVCDYTKYSSAQSSAKAVDLLRHAAIIIFRLFVSMGQSKGRSKGPGEFVAAIPGVVAAKTYPKPTAYPTTQLSNNLIVTWANWLNG